MLNAALKESGVMISSIINLFENLEHISTYPLSHESRQHKSNRKRFESVWKIFLGEIYNLMQNKRGLQKIKFYEDISELNQSNCVWEKEAAEVLTRFLKCNLKKKNGLLGVLRKELWRMFG